NARFHRRVVELLSGPGCPPNPVVSPLTAEDTTLFPAPYVSGLVAYASPWLDVCSPVPVVASVSRQVLNLEVDYANFCGVRSVIIPGPRRDSVKAVRGQPVTQYARAVQ